MPGNSPEIKAFIREYSYLFWYTPEKEKENISAELLVEQILNYGDMTAVRKLFAVMGINNSAKIFRDKINKSERHKGNFQELTLHFFTLLFNKYAPAQYNTSRNIKQGTI